MESNNENKNPNININTNNIISNKEQKIFDDILSIPEKCKRCKSNSVEIMCKECYPYIYFCLNCSQNLHSMNSKKNHKIIYLTEFNSVLFYENNNNDNNYEFNDNEFVLDNLNISQNIKNYINDIKSLYEKEKYNLNNKLNKLEKTFENSKNKYIKQINELNEKLSSFQKNKNEEMKSLEQKLTLEFNDLITSKDSKINFLLKQNEELNKYIEELLSQISKYHKEINELNKFRSNFDKIIQTQKLEIEMLTNEKNNIEEIYKEKIEKINEIYNEEKKGMINAYEEQIKKINLDYIKTKDKMKSILLQREEEINTTRNEYVNEIQILKNEIEEFKSYNKNKENNFFKLNDILNK